MNAKSLLTVTSVLELATGIALLLVPSMTVRLLLGEALESAAAIVVARVAGAALIAIGLCCWFQRESGHGRSQTGLLVALLAYNVAVPCLLAQAALVGGMRGPGLWPAAALHLLFAVWCITHLRGRSNGRAPTT